MCGACTPTISRRRALLLAGGAAVAVTGGFARSAGASAPAGLAIQPRSTWAGNERPPVGPLNSEDVRFLLVHHTASANGADPIGTMRGVYNFHTSAEKGWPDVAYNFFIDQNGVVYEARTGSLDGPVEASATGGNQGFAQLVCLLGDFTSQNPTGPALAALNATLAWLADRYSLDTSEGAQTTFVSRGSNRWPAGTSVTASTISGHRDMSQTACPGDTFYPYLVANVQREVDALRTPPAATSAPPPASTVAPVDTEPAATATAPETASTNAESTTVPDATTAPPATTATPGSTATDTTAPASTTPTTTAPSSEELVTADTASAVATTTGRDSSNGTALAVAAGAGAVAIAGAVYVGIRGRTGPPDRATPDRAAPDQRVDPPTGGRDPLA